MNYEELSWRERGRLWLRLGIRLIAAVAILLLLIFVAPPVLSLLMPFVLALIMAWLLNPLVRWLQKKLGVPRGILSLLLIILLFASAGGLLFWFGYNIVDEVRTLASNWEGVWASLQAGLGAVEGFLANLFHMLPDDIGAEAVRLLDQFVKWLQTVIPGLLGSMASNAGSMAMNIPAWAVASVIFIMAWYFITADYPRIRYAFTEHIPSEFRGFLSHVRETALGAFGGYVRAQMILSLIIFFIIFVGFMVIGQGYALLLAFLLAVMDFIPIIGSGTVMIPWAVIDLVTGNVRHAIELMVIWGIIAVFRRVAEPKVVGDQTGLSPILSLVSIYVGMRLGGVLGMILGPISCMVVINVAKGGMLTGLTDDLHLALRDVLSLLKNRPRPPQEPPEDAPESVHNSVEDC